jgi:FkbM family methyltransferase
VIARLLRSVIPPPVRAALKRVLSLPDEYRFHPARSVVEQRVVFTVRGRRLTVTADHALPLYDTIAEIVDFDAYQLAALPALGPAPLILDVGANIGVASLVLAQIPGATVIAFEPLPANATWLRENLARNAADNVNVVVKAVTGQDGTALFRSVPDESVGGQIWDGGSGETGLVTVATVSLRTALAPFEGRDVALIKIDCEGGEYEIVEQLDAELAGRIRALTFEVHDRDAARNVGTLSERLRALGYRLSSRPDLFGRRALHHLLATR